MTTKINFPSNVIRTARSDTRFGKYRFPQDLGPNGIVLDFKSYSYGRTRESVSPTARTTTSIVLPLPDQIQDAYNIIVQEAQLGFGGSTVVEAFQSGNEGQLQSTLERIAQETRRAGASAASGGFGGLTDTISGAGTYAKFLSRNLLDSLPIEGLSLAVDVINGTAINPHTTLNFDGVGLKQFEFNWTLAPRSERESEELKNIINKIKNHALPKYSTLPGGSRTGVGSADRALLKYPDLALIRFNGLSKSHFFNFKPGMISNISVNYSPNGNVFLEGGKPAMVNLAISFSEAQIHTSGAYEQDSGFSTTSGGYFDPDIGNRDGQL